MQYKNYQFLITNELFKMTGVYNKQKIQVFSINIGFILIEWYENYHISQVAITFELVDLDLRDHCLLCNTS